MGLRHMTHKLSSACAEMILSYHLSPQQIFFTHKLEPVYVTALLLCGCLFFVWVVFLFGFVFWCCVVLACWFLCVSVFVWFSERDEGIGLCIGPLPVYFCGHYSFGPCVN